MDLKTACIALARALRNGYAVERYIISHSARYEHPAWSYLKKGGKK